MSNDEHTLDRMLNGVAQDIEPVRDLWPGIQAGLQAPTVIAPRREWHLLTRIAAGFLLVALSSVTTYVLTRSAMQSDSQITANTANNNGHAIVQEYLRSRTELDRQFATRIAQLSPTTRAKLESSLADLRRAENEIVAGLSANPSDSLLQELLLSTFQSESQLLADMTELSDSNPTNTDTPRSAS